jgi:hypothetical protein
MKFSEERYQIFVEEPWLPTGDHPFFYLLSYKNSPLLQTVIDSNRVYKSDRQILITAMEDRLFRWKIIASPNALTAAKSLIAILR